MGFRKERTHYRLSFESEELQGLTVVARSLPLRDFLAMNKVSAEGEQAEQAEQLFRRFAGALIEWNLEDEDGTPVPADYDGISTLELPFVIAMIRAWMDAVATVPKVSKPGSGDTGISPAESRERALFS